MISSKRPTAQRRLARLQGWVLPIAIAMLLALQSLALVHGIVHGDRPAPASQVELDNGVALTLDPSESGHTLFGGHSDTDCRLFDQLSPTQLAPLASVAVAAGTAPTVLVAAVATPPRAASVRVRGARDPPLLA